MDDLIAAAGYTADGPGVAVVVRDADGRIHRASSGLARPDTPFTPNTVSYLASAAKQMVGACAAMLVVNGDLDVAPTIRQWLPELPARARRRLSHGRRRVAAEYRRRRRVSTADDIQRWNDALSNDGDVPRMIDLTDRILAAVSR